MLRTAAKRTLQLVVTLVAVTSVAFMLIKLLPGDPALQIIGPQYATEENLAALREELGFSDPIAVQYGRWMGAAVQGDLGVSYRSSQSVGATIVDRAPVSIELLVLAQSIAVVGALLIAPITAYRQGRWIDRTVSTVTSASLSVPAFTLGLVLIFVFAVRLRWFPATGFVPISESVIDNLVAMTLPALTLAAVPFAVYVRLLRTEMISALGDDYIMLARAKGHSDRYILFRHALRPSLLPLLTVIGINMGALIGGAVIVEQIFSLPGVGRLLVDAINGRDYLMVQGVVVFITVSYVLANFVVDLLYASVDPRISQHAA